MAGMEKLGGSYAAVTPLPLSTVFGMEYGGTVYWTVVFLIAFIVVAAVVLNQLMNDTLILKE